MTPTLILTRPLAQSESFAAKVASAWARPLDVIIAPLIEIVPVAAEMPDADMVIFTSANGVHAARNLGLRAGMTAWCVGAKTAEVAKEAGFASVIGPGDADGLVAKLINAHPTGRLAHIRGKHARGDVASRLNQAGLHCADVIAYDQKACQLSAQAQAALCADAPVVLPLFSPRSSTILSEQGPSTAPVHAIALSQAVADAIDPALGLRVTVTARPDASAMLEAVLSALAAAGGSLEGPAQAG